MNTQIFTNAQALSILFKDQNYDAALPTSLSDELIRSLILDLRYAETEPAILVDLRVEAILVAILHVALGRLKHLTGHKSIELDEERMGRLLTSYHFYLESEFVRRILGTPLKKDKEFLEELDAELMEKSH